MAQVCRRAVAQQTAIQWLIQLKIVDEDDLNEIAVLFILLQETVEPCDSHEVLCFTNDIERLPTLPLEQIASIVETGITISQALAKR